jgi:glycine betaine/choline ABC-type transport system substrate-binding protein
MRLPVLLAALALSSCTEAAVRVGSKDFTENQILAEMFALLIEDAGIPVERHIPLGDTETVFQSLRTGGIDIYPEYTGTGLELLGLPPLANDEEARQRVTEEVARVGVTVLEPLGFETTYAVVVEPDLAERLGLASISDLADAAPDLRLAVSEEYAERSEDGLQAFLDRFGLQFAEVAIVPDATRRIIYDQLIDDRSDVAIGFGTDAEIASYDLVVLDPGTGFFPSYEAVPIVSSATLKRTPGLARAINQLSDKLDTERMRMLNASATVEGNSPQVVARQALLSLGLLDDVSEDITPPFLLAVSPEDIGDPMANTVLRSARQSVTGRGVELLGTELPVSAIFDRRARVALVPSIAQFDFDETGARLRDDLETIAAVGSYQVHVLAASDGPDRVEDAERIASGPFGSPSNKLAQLMDDQISPSPAIVILDASGADAAVRALREDKADAAIVLAPLGNPALAAALEPGSGIRLIPASEWWIGSMRIGTPFLHLATIPRTAYGSDAVETLAMQATVVGPAPDAEPLGAQGPYTYGVELKPVTDQVVLTFNEKLGIHSDIGSYLRPAAALEPHAAPAARALNQTPGYTVLSLGIFLFIGWASWLLIRPEEDDRRPQ